MSLPPRPVIVSSSPVPVSVSALLLPLSVLPTTLVTVTALALRDGEVYMGLGTPGGDVQKQAMLQVFLNVSQFGMTVQQAIEQPRFGTFQFPNSFSPFMVGNFNMESSFPEATREAVKALGHPVELWPDLSPAAGAVCAVMRDPDSGWLHAGADPRREAYAIVW